MKENRKRPSSADPLGDSEQGRQVPSKNEPPVEVTRWLEASFASVAQSSHAYHPIFEKFEAEHVSQFLENAHEQDLEKARFQKSNRWFWMGYTLIGVGIFVFLTLFLLPERSDLYFDILKSLGIFGAGAAGGYGLKTYQDRRRT